MVYRFNIWARVWEMKTGITRDGLCVEVEALSLDRAWELVKAAYSHRPVMISLGGPQTWVTDVIPGGDAMRSSLR